MKPSKKGNSSEPDAAAADGGDAADGDGGDGGGDGGGVCKWLGWEMILRHNKATLTMILL